MWNIGHISDNYESEKVFSILKILNSLIRKIENFGIEFVFNVCFSKNSMILLEFFFENQFADSNTPFEKFIFFNECISDSNSIL